MSSDPNLIERLPWYLNGSLDEAESAEIERLLADSPEMQAELEATQRAASIYGHRLPTEVLVAYAFDGAHPEVPTELVERYLAVSPLGADEIRLVRESLAEMSEAKSGPVRLQPVVAARSASSWRRMALAASIAGAVALGLAGWQWFESQNRHNRLAVMEQQLREALAGESESVGDEVALRRRIEVLEGENQELAAGKGDLVEQIEAQNEELERLDGQLAELSEPMLNIPVLDVFPGDGDLVVRGESPTVRRVIVPRQTRTVTLILNSRVEADQTVTGMRILAADGAEVWGSKTRPERDELGSFTVAVPVQRLDSGIYTLELVETSGGTTSVVETYEVEIR